MQEPLPSSPRCFPGFVTIPALNPQRGAGAECVLMWLLSQMSHLPCSCSHTPFSPPSSLSLPNLLPLMAEFDLTGLVFSGTWFKFNNFAAQWARKMPEAIFLKEKKDRSYWFGQCFIIQHGQKAPWNSKKHSKQSTRKMWKPNRD